MDLFKDREDHLKYLSLLQEAIKQFPLYLYNYLLLGSTVQLLVETRQESSLSKAMEFVTREYAKYFNLKYDSAGHVFQGRFKSFTVQDEDFYFACSRYIDLNPVKSNVVANASDYEWSGYNALAHGKKEHIDLDAHDLYKKLGGTDQERQLVYRTLVMQKFGPELDLDNRKAGVLGSREFKKTVKSGGTGQDLKGTNND